MAPVRGRKKRPLESSSSIQTRSSKEKKSKEPTRLKRSLRLPVKDVTTSRKPPPAPKPVYDYERLSKLESTASTCVKDSSKANENEKSFLTSFVQEAAELLSSVPVAVLLEQVPSLPRALALASKPSFGIDAASVVTCFMYLAADGCSKQPIHKKSDSETPFDQVTELSSVARRASEWALRNLTDLMRQHVESTGHEHVLIEPWFKVHDALIPRLCESLSVTIRSLSQLTIRSFQEAIDGISQGLIRVMTNPLTHPLLSTLIIEIAAVRPSVKNVHGEHELPSEFVKAVFDVQFQTSVDERLATFNGLSIEAQAELLYLSDEGYKNHVSELRSTVTWTTQVEIIREKTRALGEAAFNHAEIHWKLMDEVRRTLRVHFPPFGLLLWKDRVWMRGTMTTAEERLGGEVVWRVAPAMRKCVGQMVILDEALRQGGNIHAGVLGAQTLYKAMKVEDGGLVSCNWHATLIVIESMVERMVWACGRSQRQKRPATGIITTEETIQICAGIIASMQTVRIRASATEKKQDKIQTSNDETEEFLRKVWENNGATNWSKRDKNAPMCSLLWTAIIAACDLGVAKRWFQQVVNADNDSHVHEFAWACSYTTHIEDNLFSNV